MPRKRKEGISSLPRYLGKMYRLFNAVIGDSTLALFAALAVTAAREEGYGPYRAVHQRLDGFLTAIGVPQAFKGLYIAAANEFVNKVIKRRIMTVDEWVKKWSSPKYGLDPNVLRRMADFIRGLPEAAKSSPKA
ncbi:MAG: hypothetical protein QXD38_07855 [Ignisphaera sp.]|uniref:hypothetical protein n=1 Tax=Thermofilum sp. TaxID=1961369 RepID=UPI00315F110F